ncbi:hypothetical protein MMC14_000106 [Varicellaria rhodocarpa]|nr:hypothetical protein [Varicellaria rhodocarpa]
MLGRVLLSSRFIHNASKNILLIGGPILLYSEYSYSQALQNDSPNKDQWPQVHAIQVGQINQDPTRLETRKALSDSRGGSGASSHLEDEDGKDDEDADDDGTAWGYVTSRFATIGSSISSIEWSSIGDSIQDFILPDWAKMLPGYISKLQRELEMATGSLADEIWQESEDIYINPEIALQARVRVGKDLCLEEKTFQALRKQHTTQAIAKYLGLSEAEVDPEDVPTIAMCGSGGGLRALVAGTGSYLSAQQAGLFDCVTYTAGVSGSCWLQTLYNSSIGGGRHENVVEHLKRRIGVHIAYPPTALNLLTTAPTNKFLLSGFVEKLKGDASADFGLVDVYGLLLAARLLVPRFELDVLDRDLKLSNQRTYLANGANPLPIYTAVRHEIPIDEKTSAQELATGGASDETKERAKQEAWFQWFEFTPYEFWCEELDAGIPTWSMGREFKDGHDVARESGLGLPELRVSLLLGIWGSAFCATLSHYYKEIQPLVKGLVGFSGIDELIEERNEDLIKLHPIGAASIPNYALGLKDRLPPTCPNSIFQTSHLQLMDAGMSNNLPIYPLLRPGRDVDILIAFDASADIKKENWLSVADGYAKQRGIKGWPLGTGWPTQDVSKDQTRQELEAASATTAQEAAGKLADAREKHREEKNTTKDAVTQGKHIDKKQADLGYCTVWIGTTQERTTSDEPPQSKRLDPDADWELLEGDVGIAVIYFPFLPNPKVPSLDPNETDFMSTWNFIYTPDQIDQVVALARANFEEGKDQTRRTVRAVYERKKAARLLREEKASISKWRRRVKEHGNHFL